MVLDRVPLYIGISGYFSKMTLTIWSNMWHLRQIENFKIYVDKGEVKRGLEGQWHPILICATSGTPSNYKN